LVAKRGEIRPDLYRSSETDDAEAAMMTSDFGPGLHVASGRPVDTSAYDRYIGRWSRLFVPSVLAAAEITAGSAVLDVATGTGEAALMTVPIVGVSGFVIGADIAPAMLRAARDRLNQPSFGPVAANGQALPFKGGSFDAVICQLGLQFFPDPARGLAEFRRVLRPGCCAAVCVISTADRAPMWGILCDVLSRFLPEQRNVLELSFALADAKQLESLFAGAGFRDISIERETRPVAFDGIDDYWDPIEAGIGSQPQAYLSLPEADRRSAREEVSARLSQFGCDGKLQMSVEMLIGKGRAT
jgi:ubiquinone/menaquinone biosynthesis C-methylase UbiE